MMWEIYILTLIVYKNVIVTEAATHWIVTETGRIEAYLESPFDLRRPYDLLTLLDQEIRNNDINKLYEDLVNRKNIIQKKLSNLEGKSNIGVKITSQDPDCLAAGKQFLDIDFYANIATNGTDRKGISIDFSKKKINNYKSSEEPQCSKFSVLINKKYPSLPRMENNTKNINLLPDNTLNQFLPVETLEQFGYDIANALKENSTSWIHYNLAAMFWRIRGDGDKAVDCIKRAIQYVPRDYQDIPLYNLAGILHQARHSREAVLMLQKAIEIAPHQAMHYFAIGNVYAAMGDYNKSVTNYIKSLELKPDQKDVIANKHATLCYWKLEKGLLSLQQSLQGILLDLHNYHSQQQQWLRLQDRLMWEHASFEYQFEGVHPVDSLHNGRIIQRCMQKTSDNSKPIISCDSYSRIPEVDQLNLQKLFQYVESEKQKISNQISKANDEQFANPDLIDDEINQIKSPPILYPKFPTTMPTSGNQYFDVTGWPSKQECLAWNLPVEDSDDLNLPLFLPPENKGYQVKKILSEYIGLEEGSQHELPWYPPVCDYPNVFGDKFVPTNDRHLLNNNLKSNSYLRNYLRRYVNDGKADEAEIGQRIITAMEKKSAPRWILATLASLYWRVRGNTRKALDCLDLAFQNIPKDTRDVVLVSIGSMMHQLGFIEHAMEFAALAFKINYVEPSTNFLLAILHYSNNNPLLAIYYMKNVLRAEPEYYDGLSKKLLKTWGCRIKLGSYNRIKESNDASKEMCNTKDTFKSEGVICSISGDQCKNAAISCYKKDDADAKPIITHSLSCDGSKPRTNLGHTIISSLLAAEGSGDVEPDQSRLERLTEIPNSQNPTEQPTHAFHMRLSLGEEHPSQEHAALGDFYVSVALTEDPDSENLLHVYDKYGTYTLSASGCKNIKILNTFKYSAVWPSIVARSLDLTPYMKPMVSEKVSDGSAPYCDEVVQITTSPLLDNIIMTILKHRLPSSPEKDLVELLGLMASDQKTSFKELGAKIGLALKENTTSWILATASAIYWRILGNTEEAVTCLRLALVTVPADRMDIPLLHLANLLNRVGFHRNALEVAEMALRTHHTFVLNHFTLANIHISMAEYEKAVAFYRACLALDSNFEPARVRLQAVLCTLLFDDANMRKQSDISD